MLQQFEMRIVVLDVYHNEYYYELKFDEIPDTIDVNYPNNFHGVKLLKDEDEDENNFNDLNKIQMKKVSICKLEANLLELIKNNRIK